MGDTTHISWADATFNPWIGCTKVSPACDGCYAEHLMQNRMGRAEWVGPGKGSGTRERTSPANWRKPLAWNRQAAKDGTRPFVFCSSLADVFDNAVPTEWRRDLFDLIRATPHLTWLLLTKRPGNIVYLFGETNPTLPGGRPGDPDPTRAWPRNAAIGCTIVTQEEADRDIPKLLAAKAALKPAFAFLSMEPLIGAVDMIRWLPAGRPARRAGTGEPFIAPHFYMTRCEHCGWVGSSELCGVDSFGDDSDVYCAACNRSICADDYPGLDWVITGGETDQGAHKARPSHPQWFRDIRDQCVAAGVVYHHKQNGEWVSVSEVEGPGAHFTFPDGATVRRTGKKLAGRTLDGVVHDARPALSLPRDPVTGRPVIA
jgi:protein gp37